VFNAEIEHDVDDPEGYRGGMVRFGPMLGASMMGTTLYARTGLPIEAPRPCACSCTRP
jgi:hypothetical protein